MRWGRCRTRATARPVVDQIDHLAIPHGVESHLPAPSIYFLRDFASTARAHAARARVQIAKRHITEHPPAFGGTTGTARTCPADCRCPRLSSLRDWAVGLGDQLHQVAVGIVEIDAAAAIEMVDLARPLAAE